MTTARKRRGPPADGGGGRVPCIAMEERERRERSRRTTRTRERERLRRMEGGRYSSVYTHDVRGRKTSVGRSVAKLERPLSREDGEAIVFVAEAAARLLLKGEEGGAQRQQVTMRGGRE